MRRPGSEDGSLISTGAGASSQPLLAIGGSAGSLPVLIGLLRGIPADLPAPVLVCQHTPQHGGSNLPEILSRASSLPTGWADDGGRLAPGHIYIAPPGHHLLVEDGETRLSTGPRVNRHRPSVDVLFASVARASADAATVVVLSGVLDDGAVGSALVDRAGGQVLVQDPDSAQFSSMPRAALKAARRAVILHDQGSLDAVEAVRRAFERRATATVTQAYETSGAGNSPTDQHFLRPGESRLIRVACPDCGGALAQVDLPDITYFRCHVGHQYGPESLIAALAETSESRLWSAVAALEEEAMLRGYVEEQRAEAGHENRQVLRSKDLWARADELRRHAQRWSGGSHEAKGVPKDQSGFEAPS